MNYEGMTTEQLFAHLQDTKEKMHSLKYAVININDVIGMLEDDINNMSLLLRKDSYQPLDIII